MKNKKPDSSVAQMSVLKDIRGLLSVTREQETAAIPKAELGIKAERVGFEDQLKQYEELVRKQQAAIDRLEGEKKALELKLSAVDSATDKPSPSNGVTDRLNLEIADIEAKKAELSVALDQIADMLQFKIKELARRIAQVYQEAGDISAGRDFRRITDQLEAAESFGEFLRALLRG